MQIGIIFNKRIKSDSRKIIAFKSWWNWWNVSKEEI